MDLGNFIAAGLVIGQFVGSKEFSEMTLVLGIIGTAIFYFAGYIVSS